MPSSLKITPRHLTVYEFIVKHKQSHDGVAPSYLEISKACGLGSTSGVQGILNTLMLLGMITYSCGKRASRNIEVVGARWLPPLNQADHVTSVSGSSTKA
jgi:hypothetical protein